jgi:DNA invertase Pin-like site-specific DNA recombinase
MWGYARVSDEAQSLNLQLDALRSAGVDAEMIFSDRVTGARADRPGLAALLDKMSPGDCLAVWRLDRLGRSVIHLAQLLEQFGNRGIAFKSLTEAIDTSCPSGRMIFSIMASLACYERELIVDRVKAGMRAAAARNVHLGRPRSLSYHQRQHARRLRQEGQSLKQIAALFEVHPATISRCVCNGEEK